MAQQQKQAVAKKPNIFLQILRGCVSNQGAIDSAKEHHWWVALLLGLLSIIIAVVPTFVSVITVNGSDYFKTYSYDMDSNLEYLVDNIGSDKFVVKNGLLSFEGTTVSDKGDIVEPYERVISEPGVIGFRAIYINQKYADITNFDAYLNNYLYRGAQGDVAYLPAFLFFYQDGFRFVIYSSVESKQTTVVMDSYNSFLWKDITDTNDLFADYITNIPGKDLPRVEYLTNFKQLMTKSYKSTKTAGVLRQTGIYLGVYAGAILLLGLMVFLMTRGKRNPFNYMTFNDGLKISCWSSLAPAILGCIFGFIMSTSSLGQIFFILILGLRIMWLTMNQLRPQY